MSRLVLSFSIFDEIHQSLFRDENESCVILFGRSVILDGKLVRIVVRDLIIPSETDFAIRTFTLVQLKSDFIATITRRVRETGESIIFVHSHPGTFDQFSKTDDDGEKILSDFLENRTPNVIHASLLLTKDKFRARILGKKESLMVHVVGNELKNDCSFNGNVKSGKYERQIRAFGKEGHDKLSSLTVAIVGTGGTGSIIAQQLAHLGVNKFYLVDPDFLEESNLNRVVGTTHLDVGKPKVDITKRLLRKDLYAV
jgi:molybdopterin-synthase adenylyltransferase